MVFGLKGKKKHPSRRRYGGERKGSYGRTAYSKRGYDRGERVYYSDDDYSSADSYYDDGVIGYYDDDEYLEDELEMDARDEERELVTRDQVLGELRAQAAADALGQSLEQMGYNLDNCDSFYSLSDTEAKDNRYIIQPKESEVSNGVDARKKSESRRRRKSKKSKAKASQSRYTVASDEDEFTEDYTRTNRREPRDYDTDAYSSIDSDEDSYFEDGTYITGRDSRFTEPASRFTGQTSRFSRRTGKLASKGRKSKSRRRGDLDTYYSRGTEWTNGDSSYFRTIGGASTLSSMSSSDNSEMEDTMYTEVTSKSGRLDDARIHSGRKTRRNGKKERRQRGMTAIKERNSDNDEGDSELEQKDHKKRGQKKLQAEWKRSDSSRLSGSSQIGAMRSVSSSRDPDKTKEQREAKKGKTKENKKGPRKQSSSSKPSKSAEEPELRSSDIESDQENKEKTKREKREKGRKPGNGEQADRSEPVDPAEDDYLKKTRRKSSKSEKKHGSESEIMENEGRTKHGQKSKKDPRADDDVEDLPPEIKDGVSDLSDPEVEAERKANASRKSKRLSRRGNNSDRDPAEEPVGDDDDDNANDREEVHRRKNSKSKMKLGNPIHDSEDNKDAQKMEGANKKRIVAETNKEEQNVEDTANGGKSMKSKATKSVKEAKGKNLKSDAEGPKFDDEKSTKTTGTKASKVSHVLTSASYRFWPRQFLSMRNKKNPQTVTDNHKVGETNDVAPEKLLESEQQEEIPMKRSSSKPSRTDKDLPAEQVGSDGDEGPNETRDENNHVSRDRSLMSSKSRGRSRSYNKASRSWHDGRSKSPAHRSRANSKGPDDTNTRTRSYKRENNAEDHDRDERILPVTDNEQMTKRVGGDEANQTSSSVGICEVAAMAALIPLAPIAAIYSCYTADATQAMMSNATAACTQECKDVTTCNEVNTPEVEMKRNKSMSENTRNSKKQRPPTATCEQSLKSTRTSGERSRKSNKSKSKPTTLSHVPTWEEAFATVANSPSKLSRLLSPRSQRTKRQQEMPQTKIQEAEEGFESFLPGSFDTSCLHFSDATTLASHGKSLMSSQTPSRREIPTIQDGREVPTIQDGSIQRAQPYASRAPPMEPGPSMAQQKSTSTADKSKKSKRWLPKLPKILQKKKEEDRVEEDRVVYLMELPKHSDGQAVTRDLAPTSFNQVAERKNGTRQSRVPDRLPIRKSSKETGQAETESMKALNSFWAETPVAYKARRMVEDQDEGDDFDEPFSPGGGDLAPFACQSKSKTCGNYDDGDIDQSILSEDDIPISLLPKNSRSKISRYSRNNQDNGDQKYYMQSTGFNGEESSHEDVLQHYDQHYDLGQTLSDVMDARQTLENAYGAHSGGGSFDNTIDEQLVELLAHMAEMDHDDAVEIEAAIKKLKKHARKLGISERDLLFSVKSAEESALTITEEDASMRDIQMPPTFGDKMLDAFEGYFGRK